MGEDKQKEKKELTYDELKNVASKLHEQNKFLIEQLQKNEYADLHKRIEYLFKVLEYSGAFACADSRFVDEVISELISILRIEKSSDVQDDKQE